ncbi:MAG: DUF3887 domain-containing protein [Dysgonamonadaceae bacterium]|jgi:hypothetical protein|nr:DUF3887 domain-containing protein [Dysgonamonadaceae bacterium]
MDNKSTFGNFTAKSFQKTRRKALAIGILALLAVLCIIVAAVHYGRKNEAGAKQEQSATVTDDIKDKAYNKTREIVQLVETNDIDKIIASFDRSTRQALPAEKLLAMWDRAQRQFGTFHGFEDDTKVLKKGGAIMTETTVKFEKINLCLQLTFDGNGQIGGFFIKPKLF